MIPQLVNLINMSRIKGLSLRIKYNKYKLKIIQKLIQLGYISYVEKQGYYLIFKSNNNFNRVKFFSPHKLGYTKKQLITFFERYNRLYNGTVLLNTDKGLCTEIQRGGQIVLYVY